MALTRYGHVAEEALVDANLQGLRRRARLHVDEFPEGSLF